MPPRPLPNDLPIHAFVTPKDLEAFLSVCHNTSSGFWLKLAKKASGVPSVALTEAIEIALCYGWINGQGLGIDKTWYLARYTPRRPKSMWSKVNVDLVEKLEKEDRMKPAGVVAVEAAKLDGRWQRAYAGPATIVVPDDLTSALAMEPTAAVFFNSLNKTDRYAVLWRIETVSPQNRAKRVEAMVQMLAVGKVPGSSSKSKSKDNSRIKKGGNLVEQQAQRSTTRLASKDTIKSNSTDFCRRPGLRPRG